MATMAANPMAKKKNGLDLISKIPQPEDERRAEECRYVSVKIDSDLPPIIREAAARRRVSVQEFMSDALNLVAAMVLEREPIARRMPPPRGRP